MLTLLGFDDVKNGVHCADHPFSSFVGGKPVILRAQTLNVACLEETKDVANELWTDPTLGTETCGTNDRP